MKAIVYKKYGPADVLHLEEVDRPIAKDNEVLVKVHATTVTAADYKIRSFTVTPMFWLFARLTFGLVRPKRTILGTELAGEVVAAGKDVTKFQEGDRVFGMDSSGFGAYAEYACRPEDGALAKMPTNITYEEAATIPHGALTALFFLRDKGNVQRDQNVLIYGASGGVGTAAVQLAKYFGAQVTGVCSTANVDMVKSLGADKVIDYKKEDFSKNSESYDIIFDTVGKTSFSLCKHLLNTNGVYLLTVFGFAQVIQMLLTSMIGDKKVICAIAPEKAEDLIFLKQRLEEGRIKSIIDKRYPLEQAAEAHQYAEKGHKKGNVVINVDSIKTR